MDTIVLVAPDSAIIVAKHAVRFRERLMGGWFPGAGDNVLIDTASVHSFGLRESINAIGLTREFTVVGAKVLRPNRAVWFRRAEYVLEMPEGSGLPRPGDRYEAHYV